MGVLVSIFTVDEATKDSLVAAQMANEGEDPNPRLIDNSLANNLGYGTLVGQWEFAAHLLTQDDFLQLRAAYDALDPQPTIYSGIDVDFLFMPLVD